MKTGSEHNPEGLSSEELVIRITITKQTGLFEILYDRHVKAIYNRCLSFTNDVAAAEDLTHDIFVKAYINLSKFNRQSKFFTWLYSIAYNHCVDFQTKKLRQSSIFESYDDVVVDEGPSDNEVFRIQYDRLNGLLNDLSIEERSLLLMKYQDSMPIKEIIKVTGLKESAIKMRLKRTKEKLLNSYQSKYKHNIY
ncbi:MAG: sigma-70 family RNA polymerase sigma factor [Cyclobacteriaceae bacterium]